MLTLGSLFDGLGGWPDAAIRAGITPVWASEIEPYCQSVTAYHYPNMKQLGDITKIDIDTLEPVDIICAGSPCQDLSIAGKREGLKGERSGLFHTAIDIVHRLRNRTGKPKFFIWENVCGAFSSNHGMDFKSVLEEIGQTEIPTPEGGRWAENGVAELPNCEIAWRVLDAQYWVPQRRKRIFLVADFGKTKRCATKILFIDKGLRGDSEKGCSERQDSPEGTGNGTEKSGTTASVLKMRSGKPGGGKGPLVKEEQSLTLSTGNDQVLFQPDAKFWDGGQTCSTLTSHNADGSQRMPDKNHFNCVLQGVGVEDGIAGTLDASYYKGQRMRGNIERTAIMTPKEEKVYSLQGSMVGRADKNGPQGSGINEDISFTLNATDRHCVAYKEDASKESANVYNICSMASNCMKSSNPNSGIQKVETARTLDGNGGNPACNQGEIMIVDKVYPKSSFATYTEDTKAGTLRASGGDFGGERESDSQIIGSLCARDYKGVGNQYVDEGKIVVERR